MTISSSFNFLLTLESGYNFLEEVMFIPLYSFDVVGLPMLKSLTLGLIYDFLSL